MASTQPSPASLATSVQPPVWSPGLRFLFRFVCSYWLFAALLPTPHVVAFLDFTRPLLRPYVRLWRQICPWVGIHVFHLAGKDVVYPPGSSTDTTLGYIQFFCYAVVALLAAVVWSILDRKREQYESLHEWLRVLVRYTLASGMLWYGIGKIFPEQFAAVDLNHGFGRLIEPYGQLSSMGASWAHPVHTQSSPGSWR